MNAKQLELFTESDFEQQKTYFRKVNDEWIIVDNINKFGRGRETHYGLVVQMRRGDVYNENTTQIRWVAMKKVKKYLFQIILP